MRPKSELKSIKTNDSDHKQSQSNTMNELQSVQPSFDPEFARHYRMIQRRKKIAKIKYTPTDIDCICKSKLVLVSREDLAKLYDQKDISAFYCDGPHTRNQKIKTKKIYHSPMEQLRDHVHGYDLGIKCLKKLKK